MARFAVTTNLDTPAAEAGETTLREAVALANAATGADEITFAAGVGGTEVLLTQGQIWVTDDLTIDGNAVGGGPDTGIDTRPAGSSRSPAMAPASTSTTWPSPTDCPPISAALSS